MTLTSLIFSMLLHRMKSEACTTYFASDIGPTAMDVCVENIREDGTTYYLNYKCINNQINELSYDTLSNCQNDIDSTSIGGGRECDKSLICNEYMLMKFTWFTDDQCVNPTKRADTIPMVLNQCIKDDDYEDNKPIYILITCINDIFTYKQYSDAQCTQFNEEFSINNTQHCYKDGFDGPVIYDFSCPSSTTESNECSNIDIFTFNWDDLTEHGDDRPAFNYKMNVDKKDLSLNIHVELKYLGSTSANEVDGLLGTTYVLDFQSFDAHKDAIYSAGSCQNRRSDVFYDGDGKLKDFNQWFKYSPFPMEDGHIGEPGDYLSYPPTNKDKWDISMGDADSCGYVVYNGHFTWQQLTECNEESKAKGVEEGRVITDSNWVNLTGVFYINIVSPFGNDKDYGYYRVYQLLSQPFIIAITKTIYVLGNVGINLLTMSIIAVYKQEHANNFRLIVLTESSDYLKLSRSSTDLAGFVGSDGLETDAFIAITTAVTETEQRANTPSGCLNNKDFICSQLWEIRAENVDCYKNSKGIDFSGIYTLSFDIKCRSEPDITSDLAIYCGSWLNDHHDIANGVTLDAKLFWKDEICEPQLFNVQFEATMNFYINDAFKNEAGSDQLYKVGEDKVYIEIITDFPMDTFNVFDTTLLNVWICTFDPIYYEHVSDPDPNQFEGGCYDKNRDGGLVDDGNKYFYHIYSLNDGIMEEGFELIGHPNDIRNTLRFYFVVPHQIARDTLYIHAQIEVDLIEENNGRRRRGMLFHTNIGQSIANQINHFIGSVGIDDGTKKPKHDIKNNYIYKVPQEPVITNPVINTSSINWSSPWIIMMAALSSMILIFNIGLLCYINFCKTKQQRNTVSFNSRRRNGYSSVKNEDNSEYDDNSENNPINGSV